MFLDRKIDERMEPVALEIKTGREYAAEFRPPSTVMNRSLHKGQSVMLYGNAIKDCR